MDASTIQKLIVSIPPLVMAITLHEVSHGYVANRLGDPTARLMGRLTLNPIKHIDPIGTVLLPLILTMLGGIIFGYAKPVPINPSNFSNPRKGMAISSAAGPITNIVLAMISSIVLALIIFPLSNLLQGDLANAFFTPLAQMLQISIQINLFLAALNLIPILPLDGGRVLEGLLPHKQSVAYSKIEPYGLYILYALILTGIAKYFIIPLYLLLKEFIPFYDKIFPY
ncbi:MAG: site-2 protease family protein [Nitrospira sp.]|nr:site-2 protease family protein [bacterium]MBL7049740.1 site-2 protease family protein [Nitrospira sp.]